MGLTDIGNQKTPGLPIEINIAAQLGLPSANQNLVIIGHAASSIAASAVYQAYNVSNSSSVSAASGEVGALFGYSSELTQMVLAAIGANAGANNFPKITTIPLASTDTGFGGSNQAMTSLLGVREPDFVVSPYDGVSSSANFNTLQSNILTLNGATRTDMQQFGSFGVVFNRSVPASTPSQLPAFNTVNMIGCWLPDSATGALAPVYSVAQSAAACAAVIAQQGIPFNPLDRVVVNGLSAPNLMSDWITVGAGLESETALNQGWTPMRVNPNSQVAFVRTVTGLVTNASNAAITAYYDVQDWQVLYFWRKTLWTRFTQPDIANQKASQAEAQLILSEIIRLANVFQDNNMFEQVQQLAKMFIVQRNSTDRSRFDVQTPVNVIPGLHVIAVNVIGTTLFDNFTV